MRIAVIGGGPGGLYFSALAQQLAAIGGQQHEITVWERNAADDTFGFGVVFSDETLGGIEHADATIHAAMQREFARWDDIDVHFRGQVVTSGGHGFAAMSRRRLLEVLQDRCADLGVRMYFRTESPDVGELAAGHELVVASDGANSAIRNRYAETFGPDLEYRRCRYMWLGTDLVFDAFSFHVEQTPYGVMQIHGYPYDATGSTFIVELHDDVWRAAGFDATEDQVFQPGESDDEAIKKIRELFAHVLGDHEIHANNSRWLRFATIRNATWRRGNVVLLGDAAHTAHFSIGSGTKLAMEDALALSQALQRHPASPEAAVTDYELERQPVVERFQEAARDSASWFENVRRYDGFDPVQFACNLLTRSGRIGHLELTRRDPAFAAAVDRRFAGRPATLLAPPPLFAPLRQRAVTLAGRVALAAGSTDDAADGQLPAAAAGRLATAAAAGAAVVVSELVAVAPEGRVTPGTPGLWADNQAGPWAEAAREVAGHGSVLALRLGHAGRRGATRPRR